jgi:hypothetical protein
LLVAMDTVLGVVDVEHEALWHDNWASRAES